MLLLSKKNKKKPRERSVGITTVHLDMNDQAEINLDLYTGKYSLQNGDYSENGYLSYDICYQGENKKRMIFSIPYDIREFVDPEKALDDFDVVCAVDTSVTKKGPLMTVGVITVMNTIRKTDGKLNGLCMAACMISHHDVESEKFENMNWLRAINWLRESSENRKILMVVDSDLGNLKRYNSRDEPVYGNEMLPEGVTLVFSSDKAKDMWSNSLIYIADKCCKDIRMRLEEKGTYGFEIPSIETHRFNRPWPVPR